MKSVALSEARSELVRGRVLEGVAALLERGEALTFAAVASAAGIPERTVYRHFPTREALLGALYEWANARVGTDGERPGDGESFTRFAISSISGSRPSSCVNVRCARNTRLSESNTCAGIRIVRA